MRISVWFMAGALVLVVAGLWLFRAIPASQAIARIPRSAAATYVPFSQLSKHEPLQEEPIAIELSDSPAPVRLADAIELAGAPPGQPAGQGPGVLGMQGTSGEHAGGGMGPGGMGPGGMGPGGMGPGGMGPGGMTAMPGAGSPGMAPPADPELDSLIQRDAALGRKVDALVAGYAAADNADIRQAFKEQLTGLLSQQFALQRQRREVELARIESRVKKMRERLNLRVKSEKIIVQRRMDQLLSDAEGLGWTSLDSPSSADRQPSEPMGSRSRVGGIESPSLDSPLPPGGAVLDADAANKASLPDEASAVDENRAAESDPFHDAGEANVEADSPIVDSESTVSGFKFSDGGTVEFDRSESMAKEARLRQAGNAQRELEARDTAELQGTWTVSKITIDDVEQNRRLSDEIWTFSENRVRSSEPKPGVSDSDKGTAMVDAQFFLNPARTPAEMTIAGPDLLIQAIYELDQDTLTVAFFTRPEIARPAGFSLATAAGADGGPINSHLCVIVLQRQKDGGAR